MNFPSELIQVSGEQAVEQMNQLMKSEESRHPVLIGDKQEVANLLDNMQLCQQNYEQILQESQKIRVPDWFSQRVSKNPNYLTSPLGEWPANPTPSYGVTIHLEPLSGSPYDEVSIALVEVDEYWKIPALLKFGGWNDCPQPWEQVAVLHYWYEKYKAIVIGMASDKLELLVQQPPTTSDDALSLAHEQFVFCPDLVFQKFSTLNALAASLINSTIWSFWWD